MLRNMDQLGGIGIFVKAAESGSFAGAARSLGMTPSAVSKAVSRLETRLGVQLFRRSTRAVDLTDDGRAFFDRVSAGLAEIQTAEAFLMQRREEPMGRLRVSAPVVFAHRVLAPHIPEFCARYPRLELEVHSTDGLSDLIDDGFDVLIRTGEFPDSGLFARKLVDSRFVTAAAPGYLAKHGTPVRPDELETHSCTAYVFPSSRRRFAWPFLVDGKNVTIDPGGGAAFTNADAMISACEAGAGILHLQDYMLGPSIAAGRLVPILQIYAADGGPVSAVYLATRHLSPNVRGFVDFFAAQLGRD